MRFRVSILDLTAAIIVLVVIVLPERSFNISHAYAAKDGQLEEIALYQARLAADPGDAMAAEKLADLLIEVDQEDWAVQVAGEAAIHSDTAAWRALLAVSMAHASRFEVHDAHGFARRALEECRKVGLDRCPGHERVRMSVYFDQLDAGVSSGIDPRIDPNGYHRAVLSRMRMIRVRGATPDVPGDGQGGAGTGVDGKDKGPGSAPGGAVDSPGGGPGEPGASEQEVPAPAGPTE
jgi:hypothetical protein